MSLIVTHAKTNQITDWTQADLDVQIAAGNFPNGTVLADIVLPSDWNDEHTLTGSLPSSSLDVTQVAHGFDAGELVYLVGTTYTLAMADDVISAEVVGMVSSVADADNFTLTTGGLVTGLSGLTAGTVYFLSPSVAGALTSTEPTTNGQVSKPLFVANSNTSGFLINYRGEVIGGGSGGTPGGSDTQVQYNNGGSFAGFGSWNGTTLGLGGTGSASAILDLISTSQGFGVPAMTTAQINAISSPRQGLMAMASDTGYLEIYSSGWQTVCTQYSAALFFSAGSLYFGEQGVNGSNRVTIKSPDSLASDYTVELPSKNGTLACLSDITSGNAEQVTVDFGATEQNLASLTVSAPWVTSSSILTATVAYENTADHSPDEALAEGITAACGNIVDGVSFDITAFAPNCTWGEYKFNVIGV